ncbi:MAG: hypothetical protein LUC31_02100 [Coprobacillus sp.]|nr:hypothetical protein [Coprobacillus sp.]
MQEVTVKGKVYQIDEVVDNHHYIVSRKGKKYFLRDYRVFNSGYTDFELTLKKINITGIIVPKVIAMDKKNKLVLTQYIPGTTCLEDICQGELTEDHYNGIFLQARYAKVEKYVLNFSPENFKLYNGKVYYLKYDVFPYDDSKAFQLNDIYLWVYSKQLVKLLESKGMPVDKSRLKDEYLTNKETVLLVVQYYR